ncbi:UNVERIFIED_CONTAM: RHOMBOID-like protein 9, chloroplastic [Sesamum calycinum]|uniref:RHOMBOID-like protein 9, chloroplastic n=1 Tax=Sesamum calycinum TaxID=2727403 RepID=A0AAW2MLX7_9LAMI
MDLDLVSDGDFSCVEVFRFVVGQWRRPFHLGPSGPHNEPLGFRSTISKYPINRVGAGLKSWWGWGELSVHVFRLKFREGPATPRVWIQVGRSDWYNEDNVHIFAWTVPSQITEPSIYMATVASNHKLFYTENNLLIAKGKREHASYDAITSPIKRTRRKSETVSKLDDLAIESSVLLRKHNVSHCSSTNWSPQKGKFCSVIKALSSTEKHLKSLDSYLGKVHNDAKQPSLENLKQRTESIGKSDQLKAGNGLKSLENYLGKVKGDVESENYVNKGFTASVSTSIKTDLESERERSYMELKTEDASGKNKYAEEAPDFYLIGVLASINIAVFLFEIATPVKNSDFGLFSLPMVYGAKINNLILTGEWWRLVTPMFLHSGIFHIALGSWVLFSFGHEVSQKYGSFTFLLIYVLGGISGNLISFLHTSEPTVGGTGPVFAIIGAWLIYQVQNKCHSNECFSKNFHNAIIATALSFVLSNFGPIDDWAHFAAACTGIAYGFVTCPSLQVKDVSPEAGRQERITLVRQYADPCKSLICFSLFLLLLSSSLFIFEPPLYPIE